MRKIRNRSEIVIQRFLVDDFSYRNFEFLTWIPPFLEIFIYIFITFNSSLTFIFIEGTFLFGKLCEIR
ncbi:unnamed protein product [Phytomonas sp. Hart1]|nr:unnamed protein product [Phytomonas sp. Hart1]|eukprot:CCW69165.1 unnamed protein product [Phytomonas sp. isolate Hart1]